MNLLSKNQGRRKVRHTRCKSRLDRLRRAAFSLVKVSFCLVYRRPQGTDPRSGLILRQAFLSSANMALLCTPYPFGRLGCLTDRRQQILGIPILHRVSHPRPLSQHRAVETFAIGGQKGGILTE
jgi:hypothetical protein